jgi:hypothetical protein
MYTQFPSWAMKDAAEAAFKALNGIGFSYLTNHDKDTFWYAEEGLDTRYKQENAKPGDFFWDGNNGDKHQVIAVDLDNQRLAFRNLEQNKELLEIAAW